MRAERRNSGQDVCEVRTHAAWCLAPQVAPDFSSAADRAGGLWESRDTEVRVNILPSKSKSTDSTDSNLWLELKNWTDFKYNKVLIISQSIRYPKALMVNTGHHHRHPIHFLYGFLIVPQVVQQLCNVIGWELPQWESISLWGMQRYKEVKHVNV